MGSEDHRDVVWRFDVVRVSPCRSVLVRVYPWPYFFQPHSLATGSISSVSPLTSKRASTGSALCGV